MTRLKIVSNKIFFSVADFEMKLNFYRFKDYSLVFTNGCFDLLHLGHIDYLSKAADLGDVLIVGMNSDGSVQKLKGINRPICDITSRAMVLASLSFVTAVLVFDEETPLQLINFIKPDVLVKGKDYALEQIVGAETVVKHGGKVVTIDLVDGYSTSLIEKKILKGVLHKDT
ncbi:MAG: adenylyltransferase/cytidyltransferase family protein [Bacteroidota bacterium]